MNNQPEETVVVTSVRQRRIFNWKNARRLLIAGAVFITLIALLFSVENWRGKRAWREFVADMQARGEPLEISELIPPPPPDELNFAQIPLLSPLLDYTMDTNGKAVWRDEAAKKRMDNFHFALRIPKEAWSDRHRERLTDFALWQTHLRNDTNYHFLTDQVSRPPIDRAAGVASGAAVTDAARYDTNRAVPEVVMALKKYDAELDALHGAMDRPHIHFPVHYEEGFAALLTHLQVFRNYARIARLKAAAALAEDRSADALKEFNLIVRMSEAADVEPLLVSQLVRIAMLNVASEVVWEGMVGRRWTDGQLGAIEKRLRGVDMVKNYSFSLRGERLGAMRGLGLIRSEPGTDGGLGGDAAVLSLFQYGPGGWFLNSTVRLGRAFDEFALPYADAEKRRFYIREAGLKMKEFDARLQKFSIYDLFVQLLFPAYGQVLDRCADCQVSVDQLRIACGVERFRLRNDRLPQALSDIEAILELPLPKDPTNGEDYRYRLDTETGGYLIYSPGADGVDDDGEPVGREKGHKRHENELGAELGDWVWRGI